MTPPRPVALVTGASSGIGEAFARALAARGHDLCLVARRADRLQALADSLTRDHGVAVLVLPFDLSEAGACERLLAAVDDAGRYVDVLVNNAGYSIAQSFDDVPWKAQQDFLMTLIVNACGLAHGVIPGMIARGGGRIIATASLAGFAPGVAGHTLYPGAKSLMMSFSQALDAEYRDRGLKVTAVSPGFVSTGFAAANGTDAVMADAPRRLFLTPEQVVDAALKANDAGRVIVVPGWWNALAAGLMRGLPQGLVRWILMKGSAKYHLAAD
ncbi:putative oxidoreductase [Brevundimonas sp. SH203]|uniref:SDR family NAD(P)-dependent oxidoreductase n=1 Tax=Brevundimonas sp. SH203 TaxID=345167 RepID=UPI0009C7ACEC|nr:SDR family oxidoreductase [Brevundimonas sp. SH203]GAW40712.1 putative oxidoreductase [Brevundimonas sp. SH203]